MVEVAGQWLASSTTFPVATDNSPSNKFLAFTPGASAWLEVTFAENSATIGSAPATRRFRHLGPRAIFTETSLLHAFANSSLNYGVAQADPLLKAFRRGEGVEIEDACGHIAGCESENATSERKVSAAKRTHVIHAQEAAVDYSGSGIGVAAVVDNPCARIVFPENGHAAAAAVIDDLAEGVVAGVRSRQG